MKKRSGSGPFLSSAADYQHEGKSIFMTWKRVKRWSSGCEASYKCVCDPVQAAAEADPADVSAVRHTEGGRVHGQVL